MINRDKPDYQNTPASQNRPDYRYVAAEQSAPLVSALMAYRDAGPEFVETIRSLQRMTLPAWECVVVDDGSVQPESLERLDHLAREEPRIRVIRQRQSGVGVARNTAYAHASGAYLLQIQSGDLVEPTFVEKAIWFLETQPQFGACGAWMVEFGATNTLWTHGFEEYEEAIAKNAVSTLAVIRRTAWEAAGGYDPAMRAELTDTDFWLRMASGGQWGYTLAEFLAWRCTQPPTRSAHATPARQRLRAAFQGRDFPQPRRALNMQQPHARISFEIPFQNRLSRPTDKKRVLCVYPNLNVGGAPKFNLDMIERLTPLGYEFTVVTSERAPNTWLANFAALTPEIYCLDTFLNRADYPRFLDYLIESRQIDAVLISNSYFGYMLTPYLRARHPHLAILDFNHAEEEWFDGGFPRMSVQVGRQLDLNVTCTNHLKEWMVTRGADASRTDVVYCCVDTAQWSANHSDPSATRRRLGIDDKTPVMLFVGRVSSEKRPLYVAKIALALARSQTKRAFVTLIAGDGPDLDQMKAFVSQHRLDGMVRFLGAQSPDSVRDLMAASDILLLPSEREGLALVLYEAMAMGVTPVAADVGGQAELVTPECGYLIPRRADETAEINAYMEAVSALLDDPKRGYTMASRAIVRVHEGFDIHAMARGMDQAIRRAQEFAATRTQASDIELGRYTVHVAVERARLKDLSDHLWAELQTCQERSVGERILARMRILPHGSRRYKAYKRSTGALKRAIRGMLNR